MPDINELFEDEIDKTISEIAPSDASNNDMSYRSKESILIEDAKVIGLKNNVNKGNNKS